MKNSRNLLLMLAIGIIFVVMLAIVTIIRLQQAPNFPQPKPIASIPASVSSLRILWNSDGQKLAIGLDNGNIMIWNVVDSNSLPSITTLDDNATKTTTVAWNKDGSILAAGHGDGKVRIWDVATSHLILTLEGHNQWISGLSLNPSGDKVSTSSVEGTIIWDVKTGDQIFTLKDNLVYPLWSLKGDLLISAGFLDPDIHIWEGESGELTTKFYAGTGNPTALSPDGRFLASGRGVYNADTGQSVTGCSDCQGIAASVAWSHDSTTVAMGSGESLCDNGNPYCVRDYGIRLINITSSNQQASLLLEGHQDNVIALEWYPDGSKLVSASWDDTTRIWDVVTGTLLKTFYVGKTRDVSKIAISPDGSKIAVIDDELNEVHIWDLSVNQ